MHEISPKETTILNLEQLSDFSHTTKTIYCKGCTNHCQLTINTFDNDRKLVSGNKCDRIVKPEAFFSDPSQYNIYAFKQQYLSRFKPEKNRRGQIGLPLQLNFLEKLPFWHTFFSHLGFEVVVSPFSTRDTYLAGQATIPSDTICYPAKLMHGHIQYLIDKGVKTIFYPCSSYNTDEGKGDNHFNCPIVAYYPEVLKHNMPALLQNKVNFISDYLSLADKRFLPKRLEEILKAYYDIPRRDIKIACEKAYKAYEDYQKAIRSQSEIIIENARARKMPIMVLAGRPYHIDAEVNHGIDQLLLQCGCAVVSEDSLAYKVKKESRKVLNQWTYHARLYDAARYVCTQKDMEIIQLVSFGCGLDAVTTDEMRDIMSAGNKIYTQIKIDEITNLGAVKIRIRSLLAALEEENQ
jgi:predicted nucleotide-binding protein (sugar kinase/HSP70/actin superfamily)